MKILIRVLLFSAVLSTVIGCGVWSFTMAAGGEPKLCFDVAKYAAALTFGLVLLWSLWNAIDDRRRELNNYRQRFGDPERWIG